MKCMVCKVEKDACLPVCKECFNSVAAITVKRTGDRHRLKHRFFVRITREADETINECLEVCGYRSRAAWLDECIRKLEAEAEARLRARRSKTMSFFGRFAR